MTGKRHLHVLRTLKNRVLIKRKADGKQPTPAEVFTKKCDQAPVDRLDAEAYGMDILSKIGTTGADGRIITPDLADFHCRQLGFTGGMQEVSIKGGDYRA